MTERLIPDTLYCYDDRMNQDLAHLHGEVTELRRVGSLSGQTLKYLRQYFRIKNIYHSNAIEGNLLNIGETRLVVMEGFTILGKPLKDSVEARNLSVALDFLEELADREGSAISGVDLRNIHSAVLRGIDDANAGKYREVQVEITGSKYRPMSPEQIAPAMEDYLSWLQHVSTSSDDGDREDPVVLACVAHAWLVYIHPFVDGNGRVARLLMNLILMRYGYPIAIITRDDRERYYDALEESQASDLTPFLALVYECVAESLEEYQQAAEEQRERQEWARSIADALGEKELGKAKNEYEIWRSAMDLLKGYFRQTAGIISEAASPGVVSVLFKDFGTLEFEKYYSLRNRISAKKTWFFRLDFHSGDRTARYLFFFGFASYALRSAMGDNAVTLQISHETTPYHYERLDSTTETIVPTLVEVGYIPEQERFMCRYRNGRIERSRVEVFGKDFIEQVTKRVS